MGLGKERLKTRHPGVDQAKKKKDRTCSPLVFRTVKHPTNLKSMAPEPRDDEQSFLILGGVDQAQTLIRSSAINLRCSARRRGLEWRFFDTLDESDPQFQTVQESLSFWFWKDLRLQPTHFASSEWSATVDCLGSNCGVRQTQQHRRELLLWVTP